YRLPLGRNGALPADAESVPLTGEWQQTPGFNANGIAQTPDRSALLVVQSSTGLLFRVDPATGEATQVDLGGTLLTNGEGLLVVGRALYAVQIQDNQVAETRLNRGRHRRDPGHDGHQSGLRHPDDRGGVRAVAVPAQRPVQHCTGAGHAVL